MAIDQAQIRVLNTIIGHIGDATGQYMSAQRVCVQLRGVLAEIVKVDQDGTLTTALAERTGVHPMVTFDRLVTVCCTLLGKSREDIEATAMDARFDDLERG